MTPEEDLTTTKTEIVALIEKLPLETLKTIRKFAIHELSSLNVVYLESESRIRTIWDHLTNSILKGEHQIVTDVHEFLLSRKPSTVAPEVTPEATSEVKPEATPVAVEVVQDSVSTVTKDITPEVTASVVAPAGA